MSQVTPSSSGRTRLLPSRFGVCCREACCPRVRALPPPLPLLCGTADLLFGLAQTLGPRRVARHRQDRRSAPRHLPRLTRFCFVYSPVLLSPQGIAARRRPPRYHAHHTANPSPRPDPSVPVAHSARLPALPRSACIRQPTKSTARGPEQHEGVFHRSHPANPAACSAPTRMISRGASSILMNVPHCTERSVNGCHPFAFLQCTC
jgi:hypothetical protein